VVTFGKLLPGGLKGRRRVVAIGGGAYVLGGYVGERTVLRFEPGTGRTRRVGRLPARVQNAATGVAGGVGYLLGGLNPAETPLSSIIRLDLAAPTGG
jgi:hypothetical protein